MERKVIGVIMSKPSLAYQTGILKGVYSVAFAHDCNVVVFGSAHPRDDEPSHIGEMSMFRLINYDKLSGVIYIPDAVMYDKKDEVITEPLLKAVREKHIPAVTIDHKYDGIPAYMCNDKPVVKSMISHMIEVHGCKDIAYLSGIEGHPHSIARMEGFREAMEEHGLKVQPNREYFGDFWYSCGEPFVDFLESAPNGMPDAIVCANGPMAESVYRNLRKRGYHIPGDIRLASFEEVESPAPFITSTNRSTSSVGRAACEGLFKVIEGESVPGSTDVMSDTTDNFQITCGCTSANEFDLLGMCKNNDTDSTVSFFSEFNTMRDSMVAISTADDMLWCMDFYTFYLEDFEGLFLCMCDGWNDPKLLMDEKQKITEFTPEMVLYYSHYTDSHGNLQKEVGNQKRFKKEDMFPLLTNGEGEPKAYVLRAVHFQDRLFGYAAITYGNRLQTPIDIFDHWLNDFSMTLEAWRRLNSARLLYSKMQLDAIMDEMTGVFNRNGFNRMFPRMIDHATKSNHDLVVILGDLNGLKHVNDTFGHNEGDELIKTAAAAISACKVPGAVAENNFRIGGDEFVKVAHGKITDENIAEFRKCVEQYLENHNNTSGKPYKVYIPLGAKLSRANEARNPDALLSEADKLMYADKVRIKTALGEDPDQR